MALSAELCPICEAPMHGPEVQFERDDCAGQVGDVAQRVVEACSAYGSDVRVRTLCGHAYHACCLLQHMFRSATNACAVCRGRVAPDQTTRPLCVSASGTEEFSEDQEAVVACTCGTFTASVPCDDQLCYKCATCFTLVGMIAFITGNAIFH